jgi:hypothetical protein
MMRSPRIASASAQGRFELSVYIFACTTIVSADGGLFCAATGRTANEIKSTAEIAGSNSRSFIRSNLQKKLNSHKSAGAHF